MHVGTRFHTRWGRVDYLGQGPHSRSTHSRPTSYAFETPPEKNLCNRAHSFLAGFFLHDCLRVVHHRQRIALILADETYGVRHPCAVVVIVRPAVLVPGRASRPAPQTPHC